MKRGVILTFAISAILLPRVAAQQQVTVTVPSIADITLAGQPGGVINQFRCGDDSSPLNSPVQVGIGLVPGHALQISTTGAVSTSGGTPTTLPDGRASGFRINTTASSELGIGTIEAPHGALIGVFLGPATPTSLMPQPPFVDYTGAGKGLPRLRPLLRQPFFMGSGTTPTGDLKTFIIPEEATRLFLGVMDTSSCNADNTGSFQVVVTAIGVAPPPPVNPVLVPAIADITLASQPDAVTNRFRCGDDSSPLNSPVQIGAVVFPGQALQIAASGAVSTSGGTPTTLPDGRASGFRINTTASSELGIGTIEAPHGALIGVFLGPDVPLRAQTPPPVDYTGAAKDLLRLTPLLQQPFFIGSGITSTGERKTFVAPEGSARLFLGVMDTSSCNSDNTGAFEVLAIGLVQLPPGTPTPILPPSSVVNGASFRPATEPNSAIAPGAIVSIFGTGLASDTLRAGEVPLPTMLGETSVTFDDIPAPLFFVSGTQINAQVPFELMTGARMVTVQVRRGSETSAAQSIAIAAVSPGIFALNEKGTGQGAILDVQFRLVDALNPAAAGEVVLIFATGMGITQPAVATGAPAPAAEPLARVVVPVEAQVGGQPATVHFSGLAPGFVGLYQVNVQVPSGVPPGAAQPVEIIINGVASNTVTIAVQ